MRRATVSFAMSVRPSVPRNKSALSLCTRLRNSRFEYFSSMSRKFKLHKIWPNNGYLMCWHFAEFSLEQEMFQTAVLVNIKTHSFCSTHFVQKSCRLWDNEGKYRTAREATEDNIIRRMRIACWITLSEYVTLIVFPLQQWLRERASMLGYTCSACLVISWRNGNRC
jgi:hypothetical protein